jgi:phospholipase/carboxylesterase
MTRMLETEFIAAEANRSRRLMVVLHGLGDSTAGYAWMPAGMQLPWMNYLLVNAPDDYYGGYSWYDFMGDSDAGIARSRQLLVETLDSQAAHRFPTDQTVLFGFSQGALMALETGLRYPARFAGLIGISGYIHNPARLLQELSPIARQQRVLMTHGTYDPLLPFERTFQQVKRLQAEGLQIEWHEFDKEHTIAGDSELDVIRRFVKAGYS